MLKIRLMRIGAKKRPFYRVVAVDERSKRTGGYIELLGTYDPMTTPHEVKLKQDRIDEWVKKGAQLSDGFLRVIGKAPQRPPRKPKKEPKAEAPADKSDKSEEASPTASEQTTSEPENQNETPVEAEAPVEEANPTEVGDGTEQQVTEESDKPEKSDEIGVEETPRPEDDQPVAEAEEEPKVEEEKPAE